MTVFVFRLIVVYYHHYSLVDVVVVGMHHSTDAADDDFDVDVYVFMLHMAFTNHHMVMVKHHSYDDYHEDDTYNR